MSHGKIGFHELNEQVSKAWSAVDEETLFFCTCLSKIESRNYKKIKKTKKTCVATKIVKGKMTAKSSKNQQHDCINGTKYPLDWINNFPREAITSPETIDTPLPSFVRLVAQESFEPDCTHGAGLSGIFSEVDMEDDEIMALWKAIPVENEFTFIHPICAKAVNRVLASDAQEEKQHDPKMTFIGTEYEKFVQ